MLSSRRHAGRPDQGKDTHPISRPGREDHIAPAESVWNITHIFAGPVKFVLAGSGHIAGVVNPPALGKYQYWLNPQPGRDARRVRRGRDRDQGQLVAGLDRLAARSGRFDRAGQGCRQPGKGSLEAIEDAPGSYVRAR